MAKKSRLDILNEEDYREIELNFPIKRNPHYLCYLVQRRNEEAQRKVREYLVDYVNKLYSRHTDDTYNRGETKR